MTSTSTLYKFFIIFILIPSLIIMFWSFINNERFIYNYRNKYEPVVNPPAPQIDEVIIDGSELYEAIKYPIYSNEYISSDDFLYEFVNIFIEKYDNDFTKLEFIYSDIVDNHFYVKVINEGIEYNYSYKLNVN